MSHTAGGPLREHEGLSGESRLAENPNFESEPGHKQRLFRFVADLYRNVMALRSGKRLFRHLCEGDSCRVPGRFDVRIVETFIVLDELLAVSNIEIEARHRDRTWCEPLSLQ